MVIAEAHNTPRTDHDPTAHAEIMAIRAAARTLGDERLTDCELWGDAGALRDVCGRNRPCPDRTALLWPRAIPRAARSNMARGCFDQPQCLHRPEIYPGIGEDEAAELLRAFLPPAALKTRRTGKGGEQQIRRFSMKGRPPRRPWFNGPLRKNRPA